MFWGWEPQEDPMNKLKFINWLITQNFNSLDATELKDLLKTRFDELIVEYSSVGEGFQNESQSTQYVLSGKKIFIVIINF